MQTFGNIVVVVAVILFLFHFEILLSIKVVAPQKPKNYSCHKSCACDLKSTQKEYKLAFDGWFHHIERYEPHSMMRAIYDENCKFRLSSHNSCGKNIKRTNTRAAKHTVQRIKIDSINADKTDTLPRYCRKVHGNRLKYLSCCLTLKHRSA